MRRDDGFITIGDYPLPVGKGIRYAAGTMLVYRYLGETRIGKGSCMPRIDDSYLECVIYLYPDVQSAQAGASFGGSGFLVMMPSKVKPSIGYIYAVTNSHVIREAHSPVIRLNTKEGGLATVPATEADWIHHPNDDDIAVITVNLFSIVARKFVHTNQFITPEIIQEQDIGPGDDIFMVGRLINHEGKQRNIPSVRFGNIAMMSLEPLLSERGILQESFVVELRSMPGYSGSPALSIFQLWCSAPVSQGLLVSEVLVLGYWVLTGVIFPWSKMFLRVTEKHRCERGGLLKPIQLWLALFQRGKSKNVWRYPNW